MIDASASCCGASLHCEDGNAIEIGDELEEPIKLVLEVDDPNPTVKCAFWDETRLASVWQVATQEHVRTPVFRRAKQGNHRNRFSLPKVIFYASSA